MKRIIYTTSQYLTETLTNGAVVLIRGTSPDGSVKPRLFAAKAVGSKEIKPGVTMVFLSPEFYRVIKENGRLKAISLYYRNEDSLRGALNLSSSNEFSIVLNSKKTPFHWKTTQHSNFLAALKEVENDILESEYSLESAEHKRRQEVISRMYQKIAIDTISALFFSQKKVYILSYSMSDAFDHEIDDTDNSKISASSYVESKVISPDSNVRAALTEFELEQPFEVLLDINTDAIIRVEADPGDYYTAPSFNTEYEIIASSIISIYVDGSEVALNDSLKTKINEINSIIKEMKPKDILKLINSKKAKPKYLTRD